MNWSRRSLRYTVPLLALAVGLSMMNLGCPRRNPPNPPAAPGSLVGWVADTEGVGIPGCTVTVDDEAKVYPVTVQTNATGQYSLGNLSAGQGLKVTFEQDGFTTTCRFVDITASKTTTANATMKARELDTLPAAEAGGVATDGQGTTKVGLPPSGLVDKFGNPVTGEVKVAVTPLDVTDPGDLGAFPGDFQAITSKKNGSQQVTLETFGLAEVVITKNGEEVNLGVGKSAQLEIKLPPQKSISSGDTIPLWWFDEEAGLWMEAGTGTVGASTSGSGLAFFATVTHFSWWNADRPIEQMDCLTGTVLAKDGTPVGGAEIVARGVSYNGESFATTNQWGEFCVNVKRGEEVEVEAVFPGGLYPAVTKTVTGLDLGGGCGSANCLDTGDYVLGYASCVQGVVYGSTGIPVPSITVYCSAGGSAVTNSGGGFCIDAPGDTDVYVYVPGSEPVMVHTPATGNCSTGGCADAVIELGGADDGDLVGWISTDNTAEGVKTHSEKLDSIALFGLTEDDAFTFSTASFISSILPPDSYKVLTDEELNYNWRDATASMTISSLDPGTPGTVAALATSANLYRWTELNGLYAPDPWLYTLFLQDPVLYTNNLDDLVEFAWPGGADIGAFDASVDLPIAVNVTNPVITAKGIGNTMSEIDLTQALTITWTPSGIGDAEAIFLITTEARDGSAEATKGLAVRAADDGSFTVPASAMSQLLADPAKTITGTYYKQDFEAVRVVMGAISVPLVGGGYGEVGVDARSNWVRGKYEHQTY
ncbi:MAG: hypothetical protein GY851_28370 [bacterium]|nr:hypothetical protein [bacterium]